MVLNQFSETPLQCGRSGKFIKRFLSSQASDEGQEFPLHAVPTTSSHAPDDRRALICGGLSPSKMFAGDLARGWAVFLWNNELKYMRSITLYYKEGGSDEVFQATIEPRNHLFVVTFAFGSGGTTLQTGLRTPIPVEFSDVERIYEKVVREKTAIGYTSSKSGIPYVQTEYANRDSGIRPQLLNAIDLKEATQRLDDPRWCMQEKMDGRRLLVKKEGAKCYGINRQGLFCELRSPAFSEINEIRGDFIIDGEIVGETFHVFDLLACNGQVWMPRPYADRLNVLEDLLADGPGKHVRKIETHFRDFDKWAWTNHFEHRRAEGLVFKLLSAPYTPGRPASGGPALKYKFTITGFFIVAGLNASRSVSLKLFGNEQCGCVTIPPNLSIPKVGCVVEVRYLYAFPDWTLYQPVYLSERDDVNPGECLIDLLKYKPEEGDNDGE